MTDSVGHVLGPCSEIELGSDASSVWFDASAPGAVRCERLLSIGWPEGRLPTTTTLTGHILDRMEYACARDVAGARLIISGGSKPAL